MNNPFTQIGFNQRIRIEWLEFTANLVLAGVGRQQIKEELRTHLKDKLSIGGDPERGNREKAITILMKLWSSPPTALLRLHKRGLEFIKNLPQEEHLPFHWGMAIAVYPFVEIVASTIGRLLRLQSTASAIAIQRRIREQRGERETVSRATRRMIRTFVDWGVLAESGEKGVYTTASTLNISSVQVSAWLIEALLHSYEGGRSALQPLIESPALFPFRLEPLNSSNLRESGTIETIRQGFDDDLVMLITKGK